MRGTVIACGLALAACGGEAPLSSSTGSESGPGATSGGQGGDGQGAGDAASVGSGVGGGTAGAGAGGVGGSGAGAGPSGTCPPSALPPGNHDGSMSFDGDTRDYHVLVPSSYDNTTPIPVVFDLHGYTSNATQQGLISGWSAMAEMHGFAVVRPEGTGGLQSWNGGDTCCGTALSQGIDDVGYMKALLAELQSQLCIDDKRVYASGLSNGGALSHRIGCDAADVFAAVAPVAYPIAFIPMSKCSPSRPIAVMHSHGTNDGTVPYNGAFGVPSAQASFEEWADIDGCSGNPVETYSKGSSHCDTFQSCQGGVEVTLCTIDGPHLLYNNDDDVPIAALAWDFFNKHTLP